MYIEFKELEIDETKFGCVRKDAKGEERPMFNLDEEQTNSKGYEKTRTGE